MTAYEEICGARTLEPTANDLTVGIDQFFDGLLEQHPWSRGVGLLKFRTPDDYVLPKCQYSARDTVKTKSYRLEPRQARGVYKVVTVAEPDSTVGEYQQDGDWPGGVSADGYEDGASETGRTFAYAQELMPKGKDKAWKPALGSILELQAMSKRDGGLVVSIEGVTSMYAYMRRAGAFFPAHTENSDLFSVNVLLPGAWSGVTIWYSVPAADFMRFKSLASTYFMTEFRKDPEYLRSKFVLIEPAVLRRSRIRCVRTVQRPGEGVITLPGAIHFGFSTGVNLAVAWNVGTPAWVPYGLDSNPYTGVYTYAFIEAFELCKLAVLKQCGGDVEKAKVAWDVAREDLVYYRDGFDPIDPQARPSRSLLNQVVPTKYVLLGGRWFVSIGLTKEERGLRYRCCCRECRVITTLILETMQYTDAEPCHRDGDHDFEPDALLTQLPYNLF